MAIIKQRCRDGFLATPLIVALVLLPPIRASALTVDAEAVRAAAAIVLAEGSYQQGPPGPSSQNTPEGERDGRQESGRAASGTSQPSVSRTGGQRSSWTNLRLPLAVEAVMFILLAAIATYVGYRVWRGVGRDPAEPARMAIVTVTPPMARAAPEETLEQADRLAAEGSSGEAVHRLLLAAVAHLRRKAGAGPAPSWTARDVLRRLELPVRARTALAILVESAERDRYGGRPSDAATYKACRACYLRLAVLAAGAGA